MNKAVATPDYNDVTPAVLEETCVQRLVYPDPAVNSEDALFFHHEGKAGFDSGARAYFALEGAEISFDSYFNAFPAHLFELEGNEVIVEVEGEGSVIAEFNLARQGRSWERLSRTRLQLVAGQPQRLRLPKVALDGLVFSSIYAVDDVLLREINYVVVGARRRDVSLTGVITTFKRDDAVQRTAERLQRYFDDNSDLKDLFSLLVIDNGGETDAVPFANGEVLKNPNLGGAGGFTRGLKTVVDRGLSSHVLFMDDDANFFPETLRRTISLFQFTKTPNLAVSGAMITEAHKWRMWENGATFNQRCKPIDNGRDLRDFAEVVSMSHSQPRHAANKYGGWWYFAFPVAEVKVWPFPFFVRGDDSYFSLANDFDIVTMPGVVAHQEDFFSKQSPTTVYLDFRYHLVHHLTFDDLKLSPAKIARMMVRYFNRYNNSYHYESAAAVNLAIRDVLSGETFWKENADMAERRKTLGALSNQEKISANLKFNANDLTVHSPRRNKGWLMNVVRAMTLNGHLLPKSLFYKKGVFFPLDVRAIEHDSYRREFTVTADPTTARGYICRINKKRYFENRREFKRLQAEVKSNYAQLVKQYKASSSNLTSPQAWAERFASGDGKSE
jgi:galactofuranosylgalactofuranosylrhamnosyl-N-acetylglucosaminyl-diphospho-decaprenol beta-1,5/1,6-galactofuranosyltransferase